MWLTADTVMIGAEAVVIKDISPEGKIEINGELWIATARGETIVAGNTVKIVAAEGLVLLVEALDSDEKNSRLRES